MRKGAFLTATGTVSITSIVRAAGPEVLPPPEFNTTDVATVICQKMGLAQGSDQFRNCLDTIKRQEDNGMKPLLRSTILTRAKTTPEMDMAAVITDPASGQEPRPEDRGVISSNNIQTAHCCVE